jgi:glycosyltransferase involved in cell wall biosynthesis
MAHARVIVAPLRIARGIQNKVLEGMAMAKPVVATPQALEGIAAIPDQEIRVAADAATQADAVLAAMREVPNDTTAVTTAGTLIGAAARRRVIQDFSWENNLARVDKLLEA